MITAKGFSKSDRKPKEHGMKTTRMTHCPENCGHTPEQHEAFDKGLAAGKAYGLNATNIFRRDPKLWDAFENGKSVGALETTYVDPTESEEYHWWKKNKVLKWSEEPPSIEGWYWWLAGDINAEPIKLLIAGGSRHSEVATASCTADLLDIEYDPDDDDSLDGYAFAFWEMTSTREMGGKWLLDEIVDLTGLN